VQLLSKVLLAKREVCQLLLHRAARCVCVCLCACVRVCVGVCVCVAGGRAYIRACVCMCACTHTRACGGVKDYIGQRSSVMM